MCGIAGFIDGTKILPVLQAMTRKISHRGPDDEGYYFQAPVALGHRRLSIIDLSAAGHQPMQFEGLTMVFNGEVYNYAEIKKELQAKGYQFSSNSDTEVVLKAFHCWQTDCINRFIGMYAFAIYDERSRELYLFRDRAGVKPLYYYHKGASFAFASELKALKPFLSKSELSALNPEAISSFFRYGYITDNISIVQDVYKLPPGHYLKFKEGKLEVTCYWSASFEEDDSLLRRTETEILDELESLMVSSFKYRMVSDVPVGIFLSGGVDSSLVASILSRHYGKIHTFTIGFEEAAFDESTAAANIASYLGTTHTSAILRPSEGHQLLDRLYDVFDEPQGDTSSVPTTFVSQLAKKNGVKVVLSADGGDELFGGYTRYSAYLARWKQINRMGTVGRQLAAGLLQAGLPFLSRGKAEQRDRFISILRQPSFAGFYQSILRTNNDRQLSDLLNDYRPSVDKVSATARLNQMIEWDFNHYLPNNNLTKVDRATMFNSIEGREPFLDHRLIEFAAKLPVEYKIRNGVKKYLLKKILGRYLPTELYDLPKKGFAAPFKDWLKNNYKPALAKTFDPHKFDNPYLNKKEVLEQVGRYQKDQEVNLVTLWHLYNFQLWYERWISEE
ncbi:MAG: asparagine synthase (glutamine-hydrolyzing) [Chitinophagaceae bacterium]